MNQETFTHNYNLYFGEYSFTVNKSSPFNAEMDVIYSINKKVFSDECKIERNVKFINAFVKKHYKKEKKHVNIKETEMSINIIIKAIKGCDSLNEWITKFIYEIDMYLYYFNMPLTKLGSHFSVIKDIIREQHQFHWIYEEPNYDDLIIKD